MGVDNKKPELVLISDIHFSLSTLSLATSSLTQAIDYAEKNTKQKKVVIAGDLIDTKAIIRGEVANELIRIFLDAQKRVSIVLIPGNHDRINEKNEPHSLNFLRPYCTLIDTVTTSDEDKMAYIPYQSSNVVFRDFVRDIPNRYIIIAHQGIQGAYLGDYYKDDSSADPKDLPKYRVISGHYHRSQHIELPEGGLWSYIGSPYSITFGEANDGPKGFQALYSDGSMELIPTNLRKHVKVERDLSNYLDPIPNLNPNDLLWITVKGSYLDLEKLDKKQIGKTHLGHSNFKLDKEYQEINKLCIENTENINDSDMLDTIIDATNESLTHKKQLKDLWREILNEI